jgi:hypothetical protein
MQMTFCETLGSIQRINPDDHFFLVEFVWEFKKIPVALCGDLPIDLF